MSSIKPFVDASEQRKRTINRIVTMAMFLAMVLPGLAFADGADQSAQDSICGILNTVNKLLSVASVVVVTIAIIFSGYQIAFAHKRISDVAPVLIGGIMIGAAAQIAKMIMGGTSTGSQCTALSGSGNGVAMLMDHLHTAVQFVQHYA